MDKAHWDRVSPLLDDLLATDPPQRVARLAALRQRDPALAAEVDPLLAQHAAIEAAGFLEQPVFKPFAAYAGRAVGSYTLERQLGQGGMGTVWLAHRSDGRFDGVVAIKFLDVALMAHGGLERFEREGRVLGGSLIRTSQNSWMQVSMPGSRIWSSSTSMVSPSIGGATLTRSRSRDASVCFAVSSLPWLTRTASSFFIGI